MARPKKSTTNAKKRYWWLIIYPESVKKSWREELTARGLKGAISPLHDRDVNEDGTTKKAHYHVILAYDGPTTYNNVKGVSDSLKQPIPKPVDNLKAAYEYLVHKNHPEKAQYSDGDLVCFGGFNPADYIAKTPSERLSDRLAVVDYIRQQDITEYCDLLDMLVDDGRLDLLDVATSNTQLCRGYIESRRWRRSVEHGNGGGECGE